jgi:electron transfer flavoprotein beta subunit
LKTVLFKKIHILFKAVSLAWGAVCSMGSNEQDPGHVILEMSEFWPENTNNSCIFFVCRAKGFCYFCRLQFLIQTNKMKILVAISNVPDTTAKISFTNGGAEFNAAGVTFIINPYDEWYALVRALELKEAGKATQVSLIHVGLADSEATIRKGLALGADDAIRVNAEGPDAYFVAEQIAKYAKDNGYELVLVGKETINYNGSSVGGMIGGMTDWAYVSLATKMDFNGTTATIEHDIDGGTQVVECTTPMVVSCAKGMAEQRIPNMRGIMAARTKPITVVEPAGNDKLTSIKSFELSKGRTDCKFIDENNMDELVNLLHTEAKVI